MHPKAGNYNSINATNIRSDCWLPLHNLGPYTSCASVKSPRSFPHEPLLSSLIFWPCWQLICRPFIYIDVYMYSIHILPSNGDCFSHLNGIMQFPKNVDGSTIYFFEGNEDAECTDAGVPLGESFLINTEHHGCPAQGMAIWEGTPLLNNTDLWHNNRDLKEPLYNNQEANLKICRIKRSWEVGVSRHWENWADHFFCKALCDLLKPSIQRKGQVGKPSNSIFPQSCYSFLSPDSPVTGSLLFTGLFPAPPRSLTRNSLNSSFLSWADFQLLVMASCYTSKSFLPCSVCLRRAIWESRSHPQQAFSYSVDQMQANLLIKASSSSLGSAFKVSFRGHVWNCL